MNTKLAKALRREAGYKRSNESSKFEDKYQFGTKIDPLSGQEVQTKTLVLKEGTKRREYKDLKRLFR